MAQPQRHQINNAQAITATGNSGVLPNLSDENNPTVILDIHCTAASGTSPSITFSLNAVLPDGSLVAIAPTVAIVAITGVSIARYIFTNVLDANLQVNWTVTGTTPSLTCDTDLLFTSTED